MTTDIPDEFVDIRDGVRALCAEFPGEYWREQDREQAYPTEFVETMTKNGYLAVLIPEEYGGSGLGIRAAMAILEEVHKSGGNAAACHAQMYIMGTILRHGSEEQKKAYLPKIATGELRLQAFGVTEPTSPEEVPGPMHPMVRVHPVSGKKALYLGRRRTWPSQYIEGIPNDSEELLDKLWAHATQPKYAWTHEWQVGDFLVWDNRCAMHRREVVNPNLPRVMWRSQFAGDKVIPG